MGQFGTKVQKVEARTWEVEGTNGDMMRIMRKESGVIAVSELYGGVL